MKNKIKKLSLSLLLISTFTGISSEAFLLERILNRPRGPSPDDMRGRQADELRHQIRNLESSTRQAQAALVQAETNLEQENANFQNFKASILRAGTTLREDLHLYQTHQNMLSNVMRRNDQEIVKIQESLTKIEQVSQLATTRLALLPDVQTSPGTVEILASAVDSNILRQEPGLVQGLRSFARAKSSIRQTIQTLTSAVTQTSAQTSDRGLRQSLSELRLAQQEQLTRANELKASARTTSESIFELTSQIEKEN